MQKLKKLIFYTFIILFLMSIHKDLTVGTFPNSDADLQNQNHSNDAKEMTVIKVQVQQGDTVLSIVEEMNQQSERINHIDIPQILTDFKDLNHGVEPLHINTGEYYYFPLY